jgi:hypothetical protein
MQENYAVLILSIFFRTHTRRMMRILMRILASYEPVMFWHRDALTPLGTVMLLAALVVVLLKLKNLKSASLKDS